MFISPVNVTLEAPVNLLAMGMHGQWRMLRGRDLDLDQVELSPGLLKRVLKFAKPYRGTLVVLLFFTVIASFLETFMPPKFSEWIINDAILKQNTRLLGLLCLLFLGVLVARSGTQVLSRWVGSRIAEGIIFDLRVALFDYVQKMPIAFFTRTQTGALISRLQSDVVGAQRAITETTTGLVGIVLSIGFAILGMLTLRSESGETWKITLMALALVPLFLAPTRRMGKVLQRLMRRQQENNAAMASQMTERFQVGGALLVKLFGNRHLEKDHFSEKAGHVRDIGIKSAVYGRIFFGLFSLVAGVGTVLIYWRGGISVISGGMEVGTLVAMIQYLTGIYMPITMLSNIRVEVMTGMVAFDRVFEVLDFPIGIADRPDAHGLVGAKGKVEFEQVSFRYPTASEVSIESLELPGIELRDREQNWVLQDVSFTIEPGKMVALVGPSGAGKTTITSLVPRLYEASSGVVRIDGHDVKELTLDSLRAAIGVVTQDAHMFHDTLHNNLLYAKPEASEEEIVNSLKAAQIYELVASLPDGLDTTVGERGYRLSGGEKQRLAIARLLLKNPAIMILDEATAHLDSESEVAIQRALAEAFQGRSSLVIAHRLSTIVNADQILVVDAGKIVERGSHFELLSSGGLYGELYRTQFERAGSMEALTETPLLEP